MAGIPISKLVGSYPKILTNKEWQSKKGKIAKMSKKTGIGAELTKAENLFKKIDVGTLDPVSSPSKTRKDLDEKVKKARAHYAAAVEPLRKQLAEVAKVAKKAGPEVKKVVASKQTVEVIGTIETTAGNYAVFLKSLDLDKAIADGEERLERLNALARKMMPQAIEKFEKGSKAFLAGDPTPDAWTKHIKQQGRSVSNSLKQWEEYNTKFWKAWSKFQGFDLNTLKMDGDDDRLAAKRVQLVQIAQKQLKAIKDFKPTT